MRVFIGLTCLGLLLLQAGALLAQTPSEAEVKRKLGLSKEESDVTTYQRDSVESFGKKTTSAAAWVKQKLAGLHITPARLSLGLGLIVILYTWNKNKKKTQWAVLSGFGVLLALFGAAAILFNWQQFN